MPGPRRSLLAAVALCAACATWRTESVPRSIDASHDLGHVRARLADGRAIELWGATVQHDTLRGYDTSFPEHRAAPILVPVADVRTLEREHFSPSRTAALIVIPIVVVATLAIVIARAFRGYDF